MAASMVFADEYGSRRNSAMRTSLKAVLAIIFLLLAQNLQAAVTLQIDASGQLTGALGVSANGGTYNVICL